MVITLATPIAQRVAFLIFIRTICCICYLIMTYGSTLSVGNIFYPEQLMMLNENDRSLNKRHYAIFAKSSQCLVLGPVFLAPWRKYSWLLDGSTGILICQHQVFRPSQVDTFTSQSAQ